MLQLIRFSLPKVFNPSKVQFENLILPNLTKRYSSYESSKPIPKPEDLPKYETTRDPKDWAYVERLLPDTYVPSIEQKKHFPSGWVPQKFNPNIPYAVKRTKNGMLPIYLRTGKIPARATRRITVVNHIYGDIWQLAAELKKYLESVEKKEVCVKVHEINGQVQVHGDHVSNTKVWALKRNL